MTTPITIAIVGATRPNGLALAHELAGNQCRLVLMSDDQSALSNIKGKLAGLAAEILTQDCAKEACWEAEVIILAVNETDALTVARKIKEVATGKTIIYVPDHLQAEGTSLSDKLAGIMPFSRIVETESPSTAAEWASAGRGQNQDHYQVQLLIK
ncbi:MAG: hypothetical protein JST14_01130 [Bacteroidetes bacterium]|nr:hypothetical protein [Bacteroidota bacterium]